MNLDRLKEFLQNYLVTVITPKYNQLREKNGLKPIELSVHDIKEGSYQPPIIHVFLDTEPSIKKQQGLKPLTVMIMSGIEKDITSFLKMFSIDSKTKVHWNKRPLF